MARKSVSTGELYFKLGLDLSELDKDFVNAQNTVKTNIGKLKGEQSRIRLRMDIDTASLGPAASKTQRLAIAEKALSNQIRLQGQVVALAKAEYDAMAAAKGKNSRESEKLQTKLLKEQKTLANMQGRLSGSKTGGGMFDSITGSVDKLQSAMLKVTAVAAAGAGFYHFLKGAQDASEAIYGLHERLNISVDDAEKLDTTLQVAGISGETFTGIMVRLNKQVLTAGDKGNEVTNTLKQFGVSLTDASGTLLPMNEELEKLAEGYKNAAASGQQEVYITQVLGARGQAMVELLREYSEIKERASKIQGGSVMDPEEAHQLALDWSDMQVQLQKLSVTLASALLPAVKELVPALKDGLGSLSAFLKEHGEELVTIGKVAAILGLGAGAAKVGSFAAGKLIAAGGGVAKGAGLAAKGAAAATGAVTMAGPLAAAYVGVKGREYEQKTGKAATEGWNEEDFLNPEKMKQFVDSGKQELAAAATKKQAEEEKRKESLKTLDAEKKNIAQKIETEKQYQKQLEKEKPIREALFKLTHSDLANSIFAIEQETKALEKQGMDKELIAKNASAKKAKVMEEYETNVVDKLNSVWDTELQSRLKQIETERKAWLKKGADEVAATKWAEKEKQDAVRNAALEAIKNDRKRLEELRSAMNADSKGKGSGYVKDNKGNVINIADVATQRGGGYVTDDKGNRIEIAGSSPQSRMQALSQKWLAEDRAKIGIKPGDTFPPELIQMYQQMQKYKENQLVPGLEGSMPVPQLAQVGQGTTKNYNVQNPVINVNIDNPVVKNESELAELADKVAERIQPAILQALGGTNNGY
jgi:hypothetical protein